MQKKKITPPKICFDPLKKNDCKKNISKYAKKNIGIFYVYFFEVVI